MFDFNNKHNLILNGSTWYQSTTHHYTHSLNIKPLCLYRQLLTTTWLGDSTFPFNSPFYFAQFFFLFKTFLWIFFYITFLTLFSTVKSNRWSYLKFWHDVMRYCMCVIQKMRVNCNLPKGRAYYQKIRAVFVEIRDEIRKQLQVFNTFRRWILDSLY